jgi:hypothetical protein
MKEYVEVVVSVFTLLTLGSGLYLAVRKFGLAREYFTFLHLTLHTRCIQDAGDLVLIAITVQLENRGDTRIGARRQRGADGYLYNAAPDVCLHAGTLKVRAVPKEKEPLLFDWYSLQPLQVVTRLFPRDELVVSEGTLEQINYLDEYQDPEGGFDEVDFWIEPREQYAQTVFLWLRPGIYAAKAFFLGPMTSHQEEEYWSCQTLYSGCLRLIAQPFARSKMRRPT